MNKFAKVCLIITAVLAALGIMLCGIGAAAGATRLATENELSGTKLSQWIRDWNWDWGWSDGWLWDDNSSYDDDDTHDVSIETAYNFTQAEVKNLELDIKAGELEIKKSGDEEIHVEVYSRRSNVNVGVEDGTLLIDEPETKYHVHRKLEIVLSIPEGMTFENISMEAQAGQIHSNIKDFTAKNVSLRVDAGEVLVQALSSTDTLDVVVNAGRAEISGVEAHHVELDCGVGELVLEGDVDGNLSGKTGIGNMEIIIDNDEDDFNYELQCGIGSIEVDGHSYTSLGGTKSIEHHADRNMNLDCGIGSIEVSFK